MDLIAMHQKMHKNTCSCVLMQVCANMEHTFESAFISLFEKLCKNSLNKDLTLLHVAQSLWCLRVSHTFHVRLHMCNLQGAHWTNCIHGSYRILSHIVYHVCCQYWTWNIRSCFIYCLFKQSGPDTLNIEAHMQYTLYVLWLWICDSLYSKCSV